MAEKRFLIALGRDLFDSPTFDQPIEADPRARLLEWPQTFAQTLQLQVETVPELTANRQQAKRTLATVDRAGWHRTGFLVTWLCAQAADRAGLLVAVTKEVEAGIRVLNTEKSMGVAAQALRAGAAEISGDRAKIAEVIGRSEFHCGASRGRVRRFDEPFRRGGPPDHRLHHPHRRRLRWGRARQYRWR